MTTNQLTETELDNIAAAGTMAGNGKDLRELLKPTDGKMVKHFTPAPSPAPAIPKLPAGIIPVKADIKA